MKKQQVDYGEVLENNWRLFWEQPFNVDFYALAKPLYFYREVMFHLTNRWRLDCMISETKLVRESGVKSARMPDKQRWGEKHPVAIECHGATWTNGRHTRGTGFENDRLKMNAALEAGIIVLEYTSTMLNNDPFGVIEQVLRVYKEYNG